MAVRITRDQDSWLARDDELVIGAVHPWLCPDGRCRLYFDSCRADAYGPLAGAIGGECYATVDAADDEALAALASAGFAENRRENEYEIPVTRAGAPVPDGICIVTAEKTELEPLMMLDCAVRADIPGSDGWPPDPADFREQTIRLVVL